MHDADKIAILESALNSIAAWGEDDLAHADEPCSARKAREALALVASESAPACPIRTAAPIELRDLRDRDSVRGGRTIAGRVAVGHHADVTPGVSIRLYGTLEEGWKPARQYDRTFRVGDVAEYDSYNLHYTGTILSIGAKTVTIGEERTNGGRVTVRQHRLSIFDFAWRNRDLDLEAIAARNADVMLNC